jgi:hypothetical protein
MSELCEKLKVSQEFMANPEQNGMAERLNRALCEMVRCMLKDSNMAKKFWVEAFKAAAYVRNRIKIEDMNNGMSSYEATMGQNPDLDFLCVFGCNCFVHVPKEKRNKLDDTSIKCKFLGYSENQKPTAS